MNTERFTHLAGIVDSTVAQNRATRLATEIIPASLPLIERTNDVLQNLDPIKDKHIRDMVLENIIKLLKTRLK